MTRSLLLCADDYGLSEAVNRAILRLVAHGRLSMVSCLVNLPAWTAGAPALAGADAVRSRRVLVGLHFNLTEGRPLAPALARLWPRLPALPALIAWAHLRTLPRDAVRDELHAQLAAFESAFGRAPDHVDGHQHVHHLPQVRALVLGLLGARPALRVRHTGRLPGPGHALKRRLIAGTGGRTLGRRLEAIGRSANRSLHGVYDFATTDYRRLMQQWLAALPADGGMVFCHPGEPELQSPDPIAAARAREFAYLDGPAFVADLSAADVSLA